MDKSKTNMDNLEYAAIVDLPMPKLWVRERMSRYHRAAQFAPFAALTGFEQLIKKEASKILQAEE